MKSKTKERVGSISKNILIAIGLLGFVAVAAVAGNAVQLLKYTPLGQKRKFKNYELNRGVKYLLNKGLLATTTKKNSEYLEITEKGRRLIQKYELESLASQKPKKWDKKYRVVIFDIAEYKKKTRDLLRLKLRSFGFICLQHSVWIYPYPCNEIIELLKKYLYLDGEVVYMTIESIENGDWLKSAFQLN